MQANRWNYEKKIILSEVNQIGKDKYGMYLLIWGIVTVKYLIAKRQSVDPERLGIQEGSRVCTWISLGGGNRIGFTSELGTCWDGNRSVWWTARGEMGWEERMEGEKDEIKEHLRDDMETSALETP